MDRDELLQVATQLMAAMLVEDRIAELKDPEFVATEVGDLADDAIRCAKALIERVDRECPPVVTFP